MNARLRPPSIPELIASAPHPTLEHLVARAFESLRPSENLTVTEAAIKYTRIGNGGGSSTPWSLDRAPYIAEPQDILTSLDYQGMVFVGPARSGKTVMSLNLLTHTVMSDPQDLLYVHMDRENARKWSKGELERYLRASTSVRAHQLTARKDDNVLDKEFDSGMRFTLTYPTASNLSGITVPRVFLIDYERGDDDIDGEGNKFDLAQMRTTTFGRYGMTAAEASPNPNKEIENPKWMPETPHQAPPIKGIFALYNRGDRRRWHTPCPHCSTYFEMDFKLLDWGAKTDPQEAKEATVMLCPSNGCVIQPRHKRSMNLKGRWVPEGYRVTDAGELVERDDVKPIRSSIASFWLKGPAAGWQDWGTLVEKYLRALKELEDTNDDTALKKTVTTDQGMYYIPLSRLSERSPEQLKEAAEDWGSSEEVPTVPEGVRFLVGTVDVQKTAFVCQITGFCNNGDKVVIDSFKLRLSDRRNESGDRLPIEPFSFGEDWDRIVSGVLLHSYALADDSGRRMGVWAVGYDTGGGQGATAHAYNLWRRVKAAGEGLHRRLIPIKGEPSRSAPRAMTRKPDSSQKDRYAIARGDVPVLFLNSNTLKDDVALHLARAIAVDGEDAGGGRLRYPDWTPDWFYSQMTNEVRTEKGWDKIGRRRNEAFDLTYYALGVAVRPMERDSPFVNIQFDRMDWSKPPAWAEEWNRNEMVFMPAGVKIAAAGEVPAAPDRWEAIRKLGEKLA